MSDPRKKMASGALWMVLFKLLDKSIGLISTLLLARLLLPADFGLVAMATSFIAMLEVLSAFGFDMALIQRQETTRAHFDTAWTFNVIIGLSIGLLMVILSMPISRFYGVPGLVPVICMLAFASALQGCENIGVVMFRKELNFAREFRYLLSKRLITFFVTVPLAIALRSYWALVIGMVAGRMGGVTLSYLMQSYRPRLSLAARGDLLHFSKWMLVINMLGFLKERSSDFVVGRFAGAHALGIFNVSSELANMPGTELVAPINRAVFPVYARLANDLNALRAEYLSVMSMVCLLAIPAVAGVAATASLIVPVVLGPNWTDAQAVLTILAFFGITQVMQSNAFAAYLALGRPDIPARVNALHVVVLITALISLTAWRGIIGAAYAYLVTATVMVPVTFAFLFPKMRVSIRDFMQVVWRPIAGATVMFFAVREFVARQSTHDASSVSLALPLLAAVGLGVAIYAITVSLLWWVAGRPTSAETMAARRVLNFIGGTAARARARLSPDMRDPPR